MTNTTTEAKLVEEILKYLVAGGGAEAVSFVHRSLREDGWKGLGRLADFESTCRRLGFVVRHGRNDRNQERTEISL